MERNNITKRKTERTKEGNHNGKQTNDLTNGRMKERNPGKPNEMMKELMQ